MSLQIHERNDVFASFTTSYSQKQALRQAAEERGVSVSAVIREALRRELVRAETRNQETR